MSYISPNFEIEEDADSQIITPQLDEDGNVDSYMYVSQLAAGKMPIVSTEDIDRDRVLLAKVDASQSMWLYSNGEIKTEV